MAAMILNVSGWKTCKFFQRASNAVSSLSLLFPERVTANVVEHATKDDYKHWLATNKDPENPSQLFVQSLGVKAASHTSSPFVWRNHREFIGGCDDTLNLLRNEVCGTVAPSSNKTSPVMMLDVDAPDAPPHTYDYDLIVIGGGSGGLAASKEAAKYGAKVAVLDYVKPSPLGSTWGIGGTCVNVGCIPKKLMHQSALLGGLLEKDAAAFGWQMGNKDTAPTHVWDTVVANIQSHIKSLNFKYRVDLRDKNVKYENLMGTFTDAHTLSCVHPEKGKSKTLTARRFIVAVGGRPSRLMIPGGDYALSSDDVFSLTSSPGRTCVIGASYVALECAGFLRGMGFPVSILVRSILLRGFDQDMATRIGSYMEEEEGVVFHHGCTPSSIVKQPDGSMAVTWHHAPTGQDTTQVFDTVLNATGRAPDVSTLGLETVGVTTDPKSKKILGTHERTSVPHIYAIGDVLQGSNELTPVAIQAGRLLARRLYNASSDVMDYALVPTAVFTPLEYGCVGISEEDAMTLLGDQLEVYHQSFTPLEWTLSDHRKRKDAGYVKLLVNARTDVVVGFHYLGPNSGEITQAVGLALRLNATFQDFLNTVGIHPTCAEIFTTLEVTKRSGADASAQGC